MLGDQPIAPQKISIAVYVPAPGNSEAKLVVDKGKPGDLICLPGRQYHIVSTLFDMGIPHDGLCVRDELDRDDGPPRAGGQGDAGDAQASRRDHDA